MEAITEMLVSLGIAAGPAEGYATQLCEDGFDTRTAFDALSLTELKEDFGFKRGHLRMVEQARDAALGEVPRDEAPRLATAKSAGARLGGGSAGRETDSEGEGSKEKNRLPLALPSEISPQRTIFGSMRFPVSAEARALAEALQVEGIHLKIVDLRPGADIRHESVFLLPFLVGLPLGACICVTCGAVRSTEVFAWVEYAHTFLVFGTHHYGEDTGNPASSCAECKCASSAQPVSIACQSSDKTD